MRSIYAKEREFLEQFITVLTHIESEYPTDAFFFEVIPVPPPNIRPVRIRLIEKTSDTNKTRRI